MAIGKVEKFFTSNLVTLQIGVSRCSGRSLSGFTLQLNFCVAGKRYFCVEFKLYYFDFLAGKIGVKKWKKIFHFFRMASAGAHNAHTLFGRGEKAERRTESSQAASKPRKMQAAQEHEAKPNAPGGDS